jgi:hypothetical protein
MSSLRAALVVPALGLGLACTAILNPRDEVQRCGSPSDCSASGDNRYDVVCVFPEGSNLDSTEVDKICVAELRQPSCDPESYQGNPEHPLIVALADNDTSRYLCAVDQLGLQGCPPRTADNPCNDGLEVVGGICDVRDSDSPARNLAILADLEAQDVLDQFCRSFFCDEEFVCDRDSGSVCVPCDPEKPFGKGGCGTVYTAGTPSCIYVDAEDECDAPDSSTDEPNFGECTI